MCLWNGELRYVESYFFSLLDYGIHIDYLRYGFDLCHVHT